MSKANSRMALLLSLLLLSLPGCQTQESKPAEVLLDPSSGSSQAYDSAQQVERGDFYRYESCSASKIFPQYTDLACPLDGVTLEELPVKEKGYVEQGQVLARFSSSQSDTHIAEAQLAIEESYRAYRKSVEEQETAIREGRQSLERLSGREKAIRELELQQMELSLSQYQAETEYALSQQEEVLEGLLDEREQLTLTAPYSGYISSVAALTEGTSLSKGTFLLRLASDSVCYFALSQIPKSLSPGSAVTFEDSQTGETFEGEIVSCDTPLPDSVKTGAAYASIGQNAASLPDRLTATICTEAKRNVCIIPSQALHKEDGQAYVYLLEDGIAKRRNVLVGGSDLDRAWIASGLEEGQMIILN